MTVADESAAGIHSLIGDLQDLHLRMKIARAEGEALPGRADEIWTTLLDDVRRVAGVASLHLREHATCKQKRLNASESAANAAETGISTALNQIASIAIGDDAGFDPRGSFVYTLWQNGVPIYVGKSVNILGCLGTHMTTPDRRYRVDRVTEARLIARWQPELNSIGIIREALSLATRGVRR